MAAEAALSALFQRLFDTLALPFLKRIGSLFGVEEEAKKLKLTLSRIKALLTDAEERQIKEESVRLWLSELKDVAYDAEDILDELECMALQSQLEKPPMQTRKRKLTDQVSVPHFRFFSWFSSNFDLGSRIMEIRERLDEIERENRHLHLKVIHGSERLKPRMRPPTCSIIDESNVFGRDADKAEVVSLLTSDDSSASNSGIQVVPVCGMGGLGKTTLAQLICKDEQVKNYFDVSAWVYVSEDFDLTRLTKAIAESVTGSACHLTNLDAIQVCIQKALSKKRFLLVLDDVWNENCNDWDALRAPLMFGARGSRILVTTRSRRVSSNMGTVPTHFLQGLSDDDCWSLFKRRAFVDGDSDAHPDLVKIGKEIVNKCNGLPLSVKTLGGLLRSVVDVVQWEAILKSEIWDLPEERNDILPALRLSYHHLPAHLKRCFAYCCVFNKGDRMDGDLLVWMWMAQGFIQSKGCKQMEEVGREYLDDLVSRYLDLSGTELERLPKSTTRLYNLQTLMLDDCCKLVELPSDFGNLVNLRHLSLGECSVSFPPRIGRLTSLQKLAHLKVGNGHRINELKDMIQLQGSLCISRLENVVNVQEAKEAELKTKRKIHSLQLEWESDDVESRQEGIEEEVLKALQPPTKLKELEIKGYCDESVVFGRETDREKGVGLLTSDDSSAENGICVVPICGMGGLGKTTLAQLVYNDQWVKNHFNERARVYVSEDFDLIRLTKAIAESVPGSAPHLTNLDAIQVSINTALSKKRFLLVLDDVWNENCNDWDALLASLMVGARGSGILVTTRSHRVSSMMGTVATHSLWGLSDDDCWSLFERRAFVEGDSDAHPDFVTIGKKIVKSAMGCLWQRRHWEVCYALK
ncbi:hypothetical protein AAC387_Pa01g1762 [Persea americana]